MRLLVISHKMCWPDSNSPSGYATTVGFPYQMEALAALFDQTTLLIPLASFEAPTGMIPLQGKNLSVALMKEPPGEDLRRYLAMITWLPRHIGLIWRLVGQADALHTPIPSDIGTIGMMIALIRRKPLFIRHCGTWGNQDTLVQRFLTWLLPNIAGGRNVVMATGGNDQPPQPGNPAIEWIFSTSLTEARYQTLTQARPWQKGETLKLIHVGRLSAGKNQVAVIRALPTIRDQVGAVHLSLLGRGDTVQRDLEALAESLGVREMVTLHGNMGHEQVMDMLAKSHIFVFPTRVKEGFPKAVLEAMAAGLPVISTGVSVVPELLKDGAGIALDATDAETVAEAILSLTAEPEKMGQMGRKARAIAAQYTLEGWGALIGQRLEAAWGEPLSEAD